MRLAGAMRDQVILHANHEGVLALPSTDESRPNAIVSRALLQSLEMRVILFHFDAGQELTDHTSPHRAIVQILSGSCAFKLGEEWHDLKAGDLVHMPPDLPHAVRATTKFSMLLTLSPVPRPALNTTPFPRITPATGTSDFR